MVRTRRSSDVEKIDRCHDREADEDEDAADKKSACPPRPTAPEKHCRKYEREKRDRETQPETEPVEGEPPLITKRNNVTETDIQAEKQSQSCYDQQTLGKGGELHHLTRIRRNYVFKGVKFYAYHGWLEEDDQQGKHAGCSYAKGWRRAS